MDLSRNLKVFSFSLLASLVSSGLSFASMDVDVAFAPDNNLNLTVNAIKSAQQSILLNIYELSSPQIADALLGQIRAGIHVEILEEGQPVGGFSAAAKGIESELASAMKNAGKGDHLYVMTSKAGGTRRYHFDHAKYAVIDGVNLLIGSENYSPTGNPLPGTLGNRGWEVFVHDAAIAKNYESVFNQDAVTSYGDVEDMTGAASLLADFSCNELCLSLESKPKSPGKPTPPPSHGSPRRNSNFGDATYSADSIQRISSPDSSLSGILGLINEARSSIDIELMTFDSAWKTGSNPIVAALQSAARRGVTIRVLLNDEAAFNQGTSNASSKNVATVGLLNGTSNMSAKIANIKGMGVDYIHNKGMIVDGSITLISSINWDANSIQNNREAAVAISSSGIASYYGAIFEKDWQVSR